MNTADQQLLLEIAKSPDRCLLNHKVKKVALKRLIDLGLIEVETHRIEPWSVTSASYHVRWLANGCPGWQTMSPGNAHHRVAAPTPAEIAAAKAEIEAGDKRHQYQRLHHVWRSRTEVHARMTMGGLQWHMEFMARGPQEL